MAAVITGLTRDHSLSAPLPARLGSLDPNDCIPPYPLHNELQLKASWYAYYERFVRSIARFDDVQFRVEVPVPRPDGDLQLDPAIVGVHPETGLPTVILSTLEFKTEASLSHEMMDALDAFGACGGVAHVWHEGEKFVVQISQWPEEPEADCRRLLKPLCRAIVQWLTREQSPWRWRRRSSCAPTGTGTLRPGGTTRRDHSSGRRRPGTTPTVTKSSASRTPHPLIAQLLALATLTQAVRSTEGPSGDDDSPVRNHALIHC